MSSHRTESEIVTPFLNLTTEDSTSDQSYNKSRLAAVTHVSVDIANVTAFYSPTFYIRDLPWRLVLQRDGDCLDFNVNCNWAERSEWSCRAEGEVRLLSHKRDRVPFEWKFQWLFCREEWGWGTCELLKWDELIDPENGYVRNGKIVVEAHITTLP